MKVRIQNDGEPGYMTKVTNAETGENLDLNITEVHIVAADEYPQALLTSIFPVIDIIADAQVRHVCPYCGKPKET